MKRKSLCLLAIILIVNTVCLARSSSVEDIKKETFVYSIKGKDTLRLDKYDLPTLEKNKPCVLFVFGGGFVGGNRAKEYYLPYFRNLVEHGYIVISIDYRLGLKKAMDESKRIEKQTGSKPKLEQSDALNIFQNTITMAVEDMFDATNYVFEHANKWHINRTKIVVSGSSAGAITAMQGEYERCNKSKLSEKLPKDFKYAGVIAFAGAILSMDGDLKWSTQSAPIQMFHGNADSNVPYDKVTIDSLNIGFYGSKYIAGKLHESKSPCYFYTVVNAGHEIASDPMKYNWAEIRLFLDKYIIDGQNLMIDTSVKDLNKPEKNREFEITDYLKANGLLF